MTNARIPPPREPEPEVEVVPRPDVPRTDPRPGGSQARVPTDVGVADPELVSPIIEPRPNVNVPKTNPQPGGSQAALPDKALQLLKAFADEAIAEGADPHAVATRFIDLSGGVPYA